MPVYLPSVLLLAFCWIAFIAILLIFLESWFGVSDLNRFVARRASGAYGICSVFLTMRGSAAEVEWTARSVFGQSYPFVELFLIYREDDAVHAALANELRSSRTHVAVRLLPVSHSLEISTDRVRALENAQPSARGRWYVVVDKGIILDPLAVEASMEFAGAGEVSALSLRPGTQASSRIHRVLAPSIDYLFQMLRMVERRRVAGSRQMRIRPPMEASYLLLNREAFEVVHRINRMPGILNEAGWNIWSYQLEGLRTFDGDASRWLWRETSFSTWPDYRGLDKRVVRRAGALIAAVSLACLISVAGLVYGILAPAATVWEGTILALSVMSYILMTISYFLYARRLHAAAWFAPFWFLVHPAAALLTYLGVRNAVSTGVSPASSRSEKRVHS